MATPSKPITIVVADDHAVVRSGLRMLLEAEPDLAVVAEAGDVGEARAALAQHEPTVLLLDLTMPGESPLEAIGGFRRSWPGTKVVVLTMLDDPAYAREALRRGVSGYVLKEAADAELTHAVREAAAGSIYLHPALGARVALGRVRPAPGEPGQPAGDGLTQRELDVLRLLALGHTNGEIAAQLSLSVRTVETHRAHIQQKLRVSGRPELVRYALRKGLLEGAT